MSVIAERPADAVESPKSAVSWGAILAGAVVAAAISLVLTILGTGLGFAAISPWATAGVSAGTFAVSAAIWLVIVQWLASAAGGFVTGRLRTRWVGLHTDEIFFRDTAHGFVTWCVSTLFVAALLGSALVSAIGGGVQAASTALSGAGQAAVTAVGESGADPMGYMVDTLLRPATTAATLPPASPETANGGFRAEASLILATGAARGEWPDADKAYLAQTVAARTGLTPEEATARVDQVIANIEAAKTEAKEAADIARKSAMTTAILASLALAIGAFIAAVSAALAGQWRDEDVPTVS